MPSVHLRLTDAELEQLRRWADDGCRSLQKEIVYRLFRDRALTERVKGVESTRGVAPQDGKLISDSQPPPVSRSVSAFPKPNMVEIGAEREKAIPPEPDPELVHWNDPPHSVSDDHFKPDPKALRPSKGKK